MAGELWQRGAAELATAIRTRQVTSREVLEAHLARVAAVNPHVNAITTVLADQARAAADAAEAVLARGGAVGRKAADLLSAAGCVVEAAEPPAVAEAHDLWGTLLGAETRTMVVPFARSMLAADAMTVIDHLIDAFPTVDLASYMEGLARRSRLAREWALFLERYDVVLGPVCCRPPFPVGYDLTAPGMADIMRNMRLVTACNLLGLPAAVVLVGVADGMPHTVQLIGGRYREDHCLAAAQHIEDQRGAVTPIDPRLE